MYFCSMKQSKTQLIQNKIRIDFDKNSNYLIITEVVDNIPRATYVVKINDINSLLPCFQAREFEITKRYRIIQSCFSIDAETSENYMILAFTKDNQIIKSHVLRFPSGWKFFDNDYKFYVFCDN